MMKWAYWSIALLLLAGGGAVVYTKTRGLRNNNPGNIRYNSYNNWVGQVGQDGDGFVIFDKPVNGIRAMARTLQSYRNRGIVTVDQIISTWAPSIENNTQSYIDEVYRRTGWERPFLPSKEEGDYLALIKAMISHENGLNPYPDSLIKQGIAAA